jgi:hypothetical protein
MLSYDVGIGFDPVYPIRRYKQAIAEAAACGAGMTVKGTEYFDNGQMTLLSVSTYALERKTIGEYNTWLQANASIYKSLRRNLAPVGLFYPGERLWLDWFRFAPIYFGVCQALTAAGIPWQVIHPDENPDCLQAVLCFDAAEKNLVSRDARVPIIVVTDLPLWKLPKEALIARNELLRKLTTGILRVGLDIYSEVRLARLLMDRLGLPKLITQSPFYYLPAQEALEQLICALPPGISPHLTTEAPILIDVWGDEDSCQVHLVNYGPDPQTVQVHFNSPISGFTISPDVGDSEYFEGNHIEVGLDIYKVLTITTERE